MEVVLEELVFREVAFQEAWMVVIDSLASGEEAWMVIRDSFRASLPHPQFLTFSKVGME